MASAGRPFGHPSFKTTFAEIYDRYQRDVDIAQHADHDEEVILLKCVGCQRIREMTPTCVRCGDDRAEPLVLMKEANDIQKVDTIIQEPLPASAAKA